MRMKIVVMMMNKLQTSHRNNQIEEIKISLAERVPLKNVHETRRSSFWLTENYEGSNSARHTSFNAALSKGLNLLI